MTASLHTRAKAIFLDLCELEEAEQRQRLKEMDIEPELRSEVASLLAFHEETPEDELDPAVGLLTESAASGDTPPLDLTPGAKVADRYRIVAQLGRGGMGEIYRADDLVLGEQVALKFLRPSVKAAHLVNEVRLARQVTHPNVCRVFDVGEVEDRPFISMEYVDGEDLASLLNRIGRIPKDRTIHLARQLFSGLAAAHAKGVLHRDLKPANIMIDGRGDVRITDFGIASHEELSRNQMIQAGTPAYMSPEQMLDQEVTVRSDIYSLGLVLYEMCTGVYPFDASTRQEYAEAHLRQSPKPPSSRVDDLDATLERVILKCLDKRPRDRPSSAMAAAAALPGGDPLSLAVAIGETPSPEMVAEAGSRGVLSSQHAWMMLGSALAMMLIVLGLSDSASQLDDAGVDLPPEVLAEKAREKLRGFGWTEPPVDQAYGFLENHFVLKEVPAGSDGPPDPSAPGASSLLFWYRQSQEPMVPSGLENLIFFGGLIGPYDPPATEPGMALVLLHPSGTLDHFELRPPSQEAADLQAEGRGPPERPAPSAGETTVGDTPAESDLPAFDLPKIFRAAGIEASRMEPSSAEFAPPFFADQRAAFRGTTFSRPDLELDVRIASYHGRPVYFRMLPADAVDSQPAASEESESWALLSVVDEWYEWWDIVVVLCALAALPLVRQNLRRGRGDRRGAGRLATAFFFAHILFSWLQAPHVLDVSIEWSLLQMHLGQGMLIGAQVWIFYLALEPYVRRHWPHSLIAWTRLLSGRHRDPLVGRSVLIGVVFGCLWALVTQLDSLLPGWLGLAYESQSISAFRFDLACGVRQSLAGVVMSLMSSVHNGVLSLLMLVLLRLLFKRPEAAIAAYVGIVAILYAHDGLHPAISWLTVGLGLAVTEVLILIRWGLVAFASAMLVRDLLTLYPLTLTLSAWYADTGLFAIGVVTLLAGMATFYALEPRIGTRRRDHSTDRYVT